MPINDSHPDVRVNLMEFWEVKNNGKITEWSWITSLDITPENVMEIAAMGRSRWRIENETFNTLKNQGYHLEHNYGHGQQYLSSTLAGLMLLTFLRDQVQEQCCELFKAARKKAGTKYNLWWKIQTYLQDIELPNWDMVWILVAGKHAKLSITIDSG